MLESDPCVADMLVQQLRATSVSRVDHAADGPSGVAMAESFDYRLVCLELLMPRLGGAQLCAALRAARRDSALLAVTAHAENISSLLGNESGIDDYIMKPVDPRELSRKAEYLIGRCREDAESKLPDSFTAGNLTILPAKKSLVLESRPVINLSSAEFELLCFLAQNAGTSLSEEDILASLWGLYPPLNFRALGIDLRVLGMKLRGPASGRRYLACARGRVTLHAEGAA